MSTRLCSFCLVMAACGVTESVDPELTSSALASWDNAAFAAQTGTFTAEFDATPSASSLDVVIGLSRASAAAYSDLATIVRFGAGTIDARNGGTYAATTAMTFAAGKTYHVRMQVDVPHHTYTVRVTPPGQAEVVLAQGFAFRSEQATVTSLANRGKLGDASGDVVIANFTALATPPPVASWINAPFAAQTGTATVTFDAVPGAAGLDSVIGLSPGAATAYTSLAAIVRFADGNTIDARNGATYASSASVPYTAGATYHVRMVVDVAARTYDVFVTPQGGAEVQLAQHFAFRSDQASATRLANLGAYNEIAPGVTISRLAVTTTTTGGGGGGGGGSGSGSGSGTTPGGFPDATTTGVPPGVTLTASGDLSISTAGTVIDALDVSGAIVISASNVTIKRSRIRSGGFWGIRVMDGLTGVTVEDCEIDGTTSGSEGNNGIWSWSPTTILRNNIYHFENPLVPGSDSLVQDNYIHDLLAPGSPHYDGIQIDGGIANVTIRHNTIINTRGETSAVMIDNYFGPISNITVDNNRLSGGDYTIYSSAQFNSNPVSGVSITNNRLGTGVYGYFDIVGNTPTISGNVDDTTGQPVN